MEEMRMERRGALKILGGMSAAAVLAAIGMLPGRGALAAWNSEAFHTQTVDDTLRALGLGPAEESSALRIIASDIAENGAVVPVSIASDLPNTTRIALLVEKNPNLLAAAFDIAEDAMPEVTTRIKMGETSNVIAIAVADGKVYSSTREIKVTLGGCGG